MRWYRRTAKGKEATRRSNEKYHKSEKGKAANARYAASAKGKAAQKRAEEKYLKSKKKDTMRRQYAKKVWKALADRYGMGTLDQIRRAIQRQLTHVGPDRPSLQSRLVRDEKRCRRAIDAIGAEYPKKLKPARPPTRLGVSRKRR